MTIINRFFTISFAFDWRGTWFTSREGTKVYVPFGLIYDDGDPRMLGAALGPLALFVLVKRRA